MQNPLPTERFSWSPLFCSVSDTIVDQVLAPIYPLPHATTSYYFGSYPVFLGILLIINGFPLDSRVTLVSL